MASLTYTQALLKTEVWDATIEKNAGTQMDTQTIMNNGVRRVLTDLDLRTTKRLAAVINLFNDVYDYTAPSDIKGIKVIDIVPQVLRSPMFETELVSAEEFDKRKNFDKHLVAFNDHDAVRKLRIAVVTNSTSFMISDLDSTTSGGGTWALRGDGTNVRADRVNFVEGSASLLWDIGAGASGLGGIQNTGLNSFDITNYFLLGSIFCWVFIQTTTNLTSFSIEIGSSSSAYYKMTATVTNEGNAFSTGWNLLRFDLSGLTTTGAPDKTKITFVSVYENSSPAIASSLNWRFDGIFIANGSFDQVLYYSKFLWQTTSTNAYKENSTATTDQLTVDTEEFNLIVLATKMESDRRLRDWNALSLDKADYMEAVAKYKLQYPSEAKPLTQTYYDTAASLNLNQDLGIISESPTNSTEPLA